MERNNTTPRGPIDDCYGLPFPSQAEPAAQRRLSTRHGARRTHAAGPVMRRSDDGYSRLSVSRRRLARPEQRTLQRGSVPVGNPLGRDPARPSRFLPALLRGIISSRAPCARSLRPPDRQTTAEDANATLRKHTVHPACISHPIHRERQFRYFGIDTREDPWAYFGSNTKITMPLRRGVPTFVVMRVAASALVWTAPGIQEGDLTRWQVLA